MHPNPGTFVETGHQAREYSAGQVTNKRNPLFASIYSQCGPHSQFFSCLANELVNVNPFPSIQKRSKQLPSPLFPQKILPRCRWTTSTTNMLPGAPLPFWQQLFRAWPLINDETQKCSESGEGKPRAFSHTKRQCSIMRTEAATGSA